MKIAVAGTGYVGLSIATLLLFFFPTLKKHTRLAAQIEAQ